MRASMRSCPWCRSSTGQRKRPVDSPTRRSSTSAEGGSCRGDPPAAHLGSLGYQLVLYPDLPIADAVMAVDRFCRELKETGNVSYRREDHLAARKTIFETIGLPEAWKIEAETTERGTSK